MEVKAHVLLTLGSRGALCKCSKRFEIPAGECEGRSTANLRDELLDRFNAHKAAMEQAR